MLECSADERNVGVIWPDMWDAGDIPGGRRLAFIAAVRCPGQKLNPTRLRWLCEPWQTSACVSKDVLRGATFTDARREQIVERSFTVIDEAQEMS